MKRILLIAVSAFILLVFLTFRGSQVPLTVSFQHEYAEVGVPLQLTVTGTSEPLSYQWYVDEVLVCTDKAYYIPTEEDLEKFISVTVTPSDPKQAVSASLYFSKLPVFYLDVTEDITKDTYVSGHLSVQGNSLYETEELLYHDTIQIRGRGNSTWEAYPKKPYRLKLEHSSNLLGMGKNKHWVLFANYADESLMRNKIAYDLSGDIGMPYMESTWVSLIFNGEYAGNYLLCEQIRIGTDRVDIANLTDYADNVARSLVKADIVPKEKQKLLETSLEQDLSWLSTGSFSFDERVYDIAAYVKLPRLTGGFLLEIDGYLDEISQFYAHKQPVMFKDPEYACTNDQIMEYAKHYFTAAFEAMQNSQDFYSVYQNQPVSYTQLFDIRSMAQYVLIQELFFNYDAILKSNFLYKDVDGLAYMGPIWDMDWSAGRTHSTIDYHQWWSLYYEKEADLPLWYAGVVKDPYFLSVLKEIWDSSYDAIHALTENNGTLEQAYDYIYESAVANSKLWPAEYGFTGSYETFRTWLLDRIQWLDSQFCDYNTLLDSFHQYDADSTIQIRVTTEGIYAQCPYGSTAVLYFNGLRLSSQSITGNNECFWPNSEYTRVADSDVAIIRIYDNAGDLIGSNCTDFRK